MSDNFLQLIPTDPHFQPSIEAAERAQSLFKGFAPKAETVEVRFNESVEFFHSGSNGSEIHCTACGAEARYWWLSAMDEAWESSFNKLEVTAHCCGASVSLNELRYDWPVGCPNRCKKNHGFSRVPNRVSPHIRRRKVI